MQQIYLTIRKINIEHGYILGIIIFTKKKHMIEIMIKTIYKYIMEKNIACQTALIK